MIKTIVKQVQRAYTDDGRNDRSFTFEEERLKTSVNKMIRAANLLSSAAQGLGDVLLSKGTKFH